MFILGKRLLLSTFFRHLGEWLVGDLAARLSPLKSQTSTLLEMALLPYFERPTHLLSMPLLRLSAYQVVGAAAHLQSLSLQI